MRSTEEAQIDRWLYQSKLQTKLWLRPNSAAACSPPIAGRSINTRLSIRHTENSSQGSAEMFLTVKLGTLRRPALLDREPTPWQKAQATFPRSSMHETTSSARLSIMAPTITAAQDRLCWRRTFKGDMQIHTGRITTNYKRSYSMTSWISLIVFRFIKEGRLLILCLLMQLLALWPIPRRLIYRNEAIWIANRWTNPRWRVRWWARQMMGPCTSRAWR